MKSTLEPLEGTEGKSLVKLSVEVDEAEFEREIDAAFRVIAREVRIPGFRPGKAPRRVLEARIGVGPAREQALRDGIPNFLARAVREHGVDLIAPPDVDITSGHEAGPVAFDATMEIRPVVTVPGYGGLRVEVEPLGATDEEAEAPITAELRRHGSLEPADRPAAIGDYLTLNVSGTRDGEPIPGLQVEDWSYELGRGWVAPDFDERLTGASAGDRLEFTTTPSGTTEDADLVVEVTAVQALALPELTDEWVAENVGEFDSVDAWRSAARERVESFKLVQIRQGFVEKAVAALADLVDDEPPATLVNNEVRARAQDTFERIQRQGLSVEQYFQLTGQDPGLFTAGLTDAATRSVKADLALRAVAAAEGLDVDDDELDDEYRRIATQVGQKPNQVRKAYERNEAVESLRTELRKRKALQWVIEHVEVVDTTGAPVDRDVLVPSGAAAAVAAEAIETEAPTPPVGDDEAE
jgi:trigger factor